MVTFFCSNCGQYLKKKQAEQHVNYCNDRLSCNDCKLNFVGFNAIKAHTQCGTAQPPKASKGTDISKIKLDDIELTGLKNVIRSVVKRAESRKLNRDTLKRLIIEVYKRNDQQLPSDFDDKFKRKLASAKNLKSEGLLVKYERI